MAPSFERLVELVYDAPLTHDGWKPFLAALSERTGARAAGIKWLAFPEAFRMVDVGLDHAIQRAYAERYAGIDTWSQVPLAAGDDVFGDEMLPRRVLEASEFYQDFCRTHEIHDIHKIVLSRTADRQVSIALLKPNRLSDPSTERRLTRRLAPHIRRALSLSTQLAAAEDARHALGEALDLVNAAVFFLDHRRHVRFCTTAAEAIVARRDGIELVRGVLHATNLDDDRRLVAHLAGSSDAPAAIVRRAGAAAPYRVFAVPRPRGGDHRIAMHAIVTEAPMPRAIEALLRHGYALTAAELRVALLVGRGQSPKRAAEVLEVSWYTVRAQLRSVFAKMGVRRQAELVELIARLERA